MGAADLVEVEAEAYQVPTRIGWVSDELTVGFDCASQ